MSSLQGTTSGGSKDHGGAPHPKRQRLEDEENAPDPTKLVIKIQGHVESFIVNRQTAIDNSLFFRAAMDDKWPNSQPGIVELEESDYATPGTVKLLQDYFEYLDDIAVNAGTDNELEPDPLESFEDFGGLANLWLSADYIQSQSITNAIMEEFEQRAADFELLDRDMFIRWWVKLENQPTWDVLRDAMLAFFVASDAIQEAESRHSIFSKLPASAKMAVVDELIRQRDDVRGELSSGLERLEGLVDDAGFKRELNTIRALADKKVAASDYYKSYINPHDSRT